MSVALEWMVSRGMNKYIESTYLENIIDYYLGHSNGAEHYAYGIIRGEVRVAPAADVVEVKHGNWILRIENNICDMTYEYKCSTCSQRSRYKTNYCPNCGAYMRETYGD